MQNRGMFSFENEIYENTLSCFSDLAYIAKNWRTR